MAEILEIIMVVSFGASWPLNVMKSYKARRVPVGKFSKRFGQNVTDIQAWGNREQLSGGHVGSRQIQPGPEVCLLSPW